MSILSKQFKKLLHLSGLAILTGLLSPFLCFSQKEIKLPQNINSVNEEYSGMATANNRLYILPQYGSNKETKLEKDFFIYSIGMDSIKMVIEGKHPAISKYRVIKVKNLDHLPASLKEQYEGFEAISIINNSVYMTIETADTYQCCYIIKGQLNTIKNEIVIDTSKTRKLPRFSFINNAGFESLAYLPGQNRLLAIGEFNASAYGSKGYLIDTGMNHEPEAVNIPQAFFRITDITADDSSVYALNYYWNGDYNDYFNNCMVRGAETIAVNIPDIKEKMIEQQGYLTAPLTCYTRIIKLNTELRGQWEQVKQLETTCSGNNWEGLIMLDKGFLIISDANRSSKLKTTLQYIEK